MPIDGHFVGNFFDAFSRTKFAADDTARKKKEAKLTGQLVELQIQNLQNQTTAQNTVAEMLDPQPQEFSLDNIQGPGQEGIGSLTKRPEYSSLVDMIADQGPLLSEAGMLGDAVSLQRQQPEALQLANALGLDTSDPTVQDMLIRSLNGQSSQDNALDFLLNDALFKSRDLGNQETERLENVRVKGHKVNLREDLRRTKKLIKSTKDLLNTPLEPGTPGEQRWKEGYVSLAAVLGGPFGIKNAKILQGISETMTKQLADGVIRSLENVSKGGQNATAFTSIRDANANMEISPQAILNVVAEQLRFSLNDAEINSVEIPQREEILEVIRQIESGDALRATNEQGVIIDVPALIASIAKMSLQQLKDLDIRGASDDVMAAFAARLEELTGG